MKQKTHKAASKRLTVTKTGKVKHRECGQNHFRSRKNRNKIRDTRTDNTLDASHKKTVETLLPN